MFIGFNLELSWFDQDYFDKGLKLYNENKKRIKKSIDSFILDDGSLDGSSMQTNWFPQIESDIFISHSHKDEKRAIALAGWLNKEFGLNTFIDSCIWGYANELLRTIDNSYCLQTDGYYSYQKRNNSTSHVHMMLSTALLMMMDNTECVFFLNTPSSISTNEVIDKTESPWIYSELAFTQFIRQNVPDRLKLYDLTETFSGADGKLEKGGRLIIKYEVDLTHLITINGSNLDKWKERYVKGHALDKFYELNT